MCKPGLRVILPKWLADTYRYRRCHRQRDGNRQQHSGWRTATLLGLIVLSLQAHAVPQTPQGMSKADSQQLLDAIAAQPPSYQPRTEHLAEDGSPHYVNRLILQESPYLLQHAHNPINWYAWGDEAFQAARDSGKPVFLSIGYATCHWCHVMERESFESIAVAEFLNEYFIAIKVDREQHPDVDATYMTAVQMMTGGGGWPLSNWLTGDGKPFYGGTYYPADGFLQILRQIQSAWSERRQEVIEQADKVARALHEVNSVKATAATVADAQIEATVASLMSGYDDLQGGFGAAPKFPRESSLLLLLEHARRTGNQVTSQAVDFTLQRIASGGIHDQIGGGFHRYAVDPDWLVPHFEKMLYNQAYLARAYLQAWELTREPEHRRVAERALDYVLREMTTSDGLFYSATDADSDGAEGRFFVWTPEQIRSVLSDSDADFAIAVWRMTDEGNFEGSNILNLEAPPESVATALDLPLPEFLQRLETISAQLLQARNQRVPPLRDDKVITAWNGMMIQALAEASITLQKPVYLQAALRATERLLQVHRLDDGRLWRTSYRGKSSVLARQADYVFFAEALLTLFDATADTRWLDVAEQLVALMNQDFLDPDNGTYFMGVDTAAALPLRPKEFFDNATPGGNSTALRVLVRLWHRTGKDSYHEQAERLIAALAGRLQQSPASFAYFMLAVSELRHGESAAIAYAGRGKVRVQADWSTAATEVATEAATAQTGVADLQLQLFIADGWHVNAHEPLQDYLVGTLVEDSNGAPLAGVNYPAPQHRTLGFDRSELALYDGQVKLRVPAAAVPVSVEGAPPALPATVAISLQACNDEVCLAPETIRLSVARP